MRILAAQKAVLHPSGLFDIENGGIEIVTGNGVLPIGIRLFLLVEVPRTELSAGKHPVRISVSGIVTGSNSLGDAMAPPNVLAGNKGGWYFVFPFNANVDKYGTIHVEVTIGPAVGTHDLHVVPPQQQTTSAYPAN
jgi:hypothetical protein